MTTPIADIKLIGPRLCEVTVGESRRVYLTTRSAVGIALLQEAMTESPVDAVSQCVWTDMLATHGVAIGVRPQERVVVAVIPEAKRTVKWTGPLYASAADAVGRPVTEQVLELLFPPCLAMLKISATQQYLKGTLSCVKPDAVKTLSVQSDAHVLAPFPYGNVYTSGHRICWGTVVHSTVNTVEALLQSFFQSGFNNDLFAAAVCGSRARNLPEMVQGAVTVNGTPVLPVAAAYFTTSMAAQVQLVQNSTTA